MFLPKTKQRTTTTTRGRTRRRLRQRIRRLPQVHHRDHRHPLHCQTKMYPMPPCRRQSSIVGLPQHPTTGSNGPRKAPLVALVVVVAVAIMVALVVMVVVVMVEEPTTGNSGPRIPIRRPHQIPPVLVVAMRGRPRMTGISGSTRTRTRASRLLVPFPRTVPLNSPLIRL